MVDRIFRRRNRLEASAYCGAGTVLFTLCTHQRHRLFSAPDVVLPLASCLHCELARDAVDVDAVCFMPDHLHVLVSSTAPVDLRRGIWRFKQSTGFWYRRAWGSTLWQKSFHDRILRRDDAVEKAALYVLENPVRAGLCEGWREHPFSWSRWHDPLSGTI